MNLREKRKEEIYKLIYKNAKKLFEKKTYEKTSINDICEKTGIATGTFYYYFKTKDELMIGLVVQHLENNWIFTNQECDSLQDYIKLYTNSFERVINIGKETLRIFFASLFNQASMDQDKLKSNLQMVYKEFNEISYSLLHYLAEYNSEINNSAVLVQNINSAYESKLMNYVFIDDYEPKETVRLFEMMITSIVEKKY